LWNASEDDDCHCHFGPLWKNYRTVLFDALVIKMSLKHHSLLRFLLLFGALVVHPGGIWSFPLQE
jgi:hypothetical protein